MLESQWCGKLILWWYYFDEEGTAVAASRTFEKDMYPGEERVIQFSWVYPPALQKGECPGGLCVKQVERVEITPIIRAW